MNSPYRVEVLPTAARALAALPARERGRIARRIDALAEEPRPPGNVRLQGKREFHRIRVGVYRIIYRIEEQNLVVVVVRVAHRRSACRNL